MLLLICYREYKKQNITPEERNIERSQTERSLTKECPWKRNVLRRSGKNKPSKVWSDQCRNDEGSSHENMKTRGGSGPSGLDVDGWKRILLSKNFGEFLQIFVKNTSQSN